MSFKKRLARAFRALSGYRLSVAPDPACARKVGATETAYHYLGPDLALTRLTNGHLLYVDPQDETMSAHMIAYGHWESWVYSVVMSLISPGDRVIEVGANVGYYTMAMAAQAGSQGSVIAFEANPRLADLIRRSAYINGFPDRVKVVPKAVLDQPGLIPFEISRKHSGWGYVNIWDRTAYDDSIVLQVEAVRLDDLGGDAVDFIRMDAEGSEPFILRGAERLLRANPQVTICTEWSPVQMASRTSVPDFVDWLSGLGFHFWRIEHDSTLSRVPPERMAGLEPCDVILSRRLLEPPGDMPVAT